MKKLGTLFLLLLGLEAVAATTGSLTVSGSVAATTAIVVTPISGYNSIPLNVTQVDLPVANVREINNTSTGYTVSISSLNSGALKNGSIGQITYTAKYNGTAFSLSSTPVTVTTQGVQTGIVNSVKSFTISFTGINMEDFMAGTYSDTLTFVIMAN
jgi:hypothetical protein